MDLQNAEDDCCNTHTHTRYLLFYVKNSASDHLFGAPGSWTYLVSATNENQTDAEQKGICSGTN